MSMVDLVNTFIGVPPTNLAWLNYLIASIMFLYLYVFMIELFMLVFRIGKRK